ncbi:hypothetical protein TNCV_2431901 [Trichonephila clavipes]|nr:hypothetical protein TNCV_2431901 [Trichonephila clavipes]
MVKYELKPWIYLNKRKYVYWYYDKITSIHQRNIYKAYFESEYPTYCKVLELLRSVLDRFKSLEDILEESQKGTEEHERIEYLLCNSYTKYLQDPNFNSVVSKLQQLHEKLSYIKKLIIEYDEKNN